MALIHSGLVYQRRRNRWKEFWLGVDRRGMLKWKRKDAVLLISSVQVSEVIDRVQVDGADDQSDPEQRVYYLKTPVFVGRRTRLERFALMSGADLELWLDALATSVDAWSAYKAVKRRQASQLAAENRVDERVVEARLNYQQSIQYYKNVWREFLRFRSSDEAKTAKSPAVLASDRLSSLGPYIPSDSWHVIEEKKDLNQLKIEEDDYSEKSTLVEDKFCGNVSQSRMQSNNNYVTVIYVKQYSSDEDDDNDSYFNVHL